MGVTRSILRHRAAQFFSYMLLMTAGFAQSGPTLPAAYTTGYFYDVGGRQTGIIRPDPGDVSSPVYLATRNQYDTTSGNLVEVDIGSLASWPSAGTAPSQWTFTTVYQKKTFTYDTMGRRLTEELFGQDGNAYQLTQYSYDAMGRQQCVAIRMNPAVYGSLPASACTLGTTGSNGPDRITYTTYDATSRPLKIQRAYGTSLVEAYATYTYTANHFQQSITDANNNQTWLTYDGLDRLSQTNFPSKTTSGSYSTTDFEQYTSDANNNRKTLVTRDSQTITYNYDNLNRLTSKLWPSSWGAESTVYYGYDLRNLQLCANYGSACTVVNPATSTASVASDGVTTSFDGFGHVSTQMVNLSGTPQTMSYQYDADGSRAQVTYPDGNYIQYKFDGLDRLSQALENGSASAVLAAYSYDSAGRVQQITRGGGVTTTALGYDAVSRLSSYSHALGTSADNVSYSFSYNPADQILTQGISNNEYESQQDTAQGYTPNGLNEYKAVGGVSYSWDPRGNLTSNGSTTYSYDLENRLTGATGTCSASLTYDPLGRLYQTTCGSTTTTFTYDGDRIALEYNSSGSLLRRYAFGPEGDNPIVWYEGSTVGQPNRRYLHPDHQGSIVTVTDATGVTLAVNQYSPYGAIGSSNQGRFQFTGQAYVTEVGLHYYKARMYNASLGRFMQTDPVGYKDDLNLYTYVGNDPLDRTDPTGKSILEVGFLVADVAELGGAIASGEGIGWAIANVAIDAVGVASPVPGISEVAHAIEGAAKIEKGVKLTLRVKEGWSEAQIAEAAQKAQSLDKLAKEGKLTVTKNPERSATSGVDRYRKAGGEVSKGQDVDHTHDLQLGGQDAPNNMAALDSSVNRSFGAQVHQQIKDLPAGTKICEVTLVCNLSLESHMIP